MKILILCAVVSGVGVITGCRSGTSERVAGAKPNREACETCVRSRRDNPVITGLVPLETANGADDVNREIAERNKLGFVYHNFRLDSSASGDDSKGATTQALTPMPNVMGKTEADERSPTTSLAWELHGSELGYGMSTIRTARTNRTGTSTVDSKQDPVKVDLDPTVMLVPIQVVRIVAQDPALPFASKLKEFSSAVQKRNWDYRTNLDTFRQQEAGSPNLLAQHAINAVESPFTPPDEVWDQCGIQFRMINCPGHEFGCPDLVVSEPDRIVAKTCPADTSDDPSMAANWRDARALPGIRRDLPLVTFTWWATQPGCVKGAITRPRTLDVAMGFGPRFGTSNLDELALAHELGHILGLGHGGDCVDESKFHLMCADVVSPRIFPEQCQVARENAAKFVQRLWGVNVTP